MILAIDIGNSNIVISLYLQENWTHTFRYETKSVQPASFYEKSILTLFLEWNVSPANLQLVIISSVVPVINATIIKAIEGITVSKVILLNPELFQQLDITIPKPYEIGSDLVANAYAALHLYGDEVIVADFGTALSFTIASKTKGIEGVTLAPGLKTAAQSLVDQTAQLPMIPLQLPGSAIGTDTISAMQAGILYGYVGLVREIVSRIREEIGADYKLIGTGGLSSILHPLNEDFYVINKHLTLEGMRLIGKHFS